MRRVGMAASVVLSGVMIGLPLVFAESRPLEQLPKDLLRWSTLWMDIPKQMYEVGQEEGPLAALTWGPTKGTAVMLQSTTQELWDVVKPDKRPQRSQGVDNPKGLIVRYEF